MRTTETGRQTRPACPTATGLGAQEEQGRRSLDKKMSVGGTQITETIRTQEVVEEFADIFVGLKSVVNGGLEFSVDVAEVELEVNGLDELNKLLSHGPYVLRGKG